jgi:hypothetical protein
VDGWTIGVAGAGVVTGEDVSGSLAGCEDCSFSRIVLVSVGADDLGDVVTVDFFLGAFCAAAFRSVFVTVCTRGATTGVAISGVSAGVDCSVGAGTAAGGAIVCAGGVSGTGSFVDITFCVACVGRMLCDV